MQTVFFECDMRKYSTRSMNKVWAFRRTPYSLDARSRGSREKRCIFSHDLAQVWYIAAQTSAICTDTDIRPKKTNQYTECEKEVWNSEISLLDTFVKYCKCIMNHVRLDGSFSHLCCRLSLQDVSWDIALFPLRFTPQFDFAITDRYSYEKINTASLSTVRWADLSTQHSSPHQALA